MGQDFSISENEQALAAFRGEGFYSSEGRIADYTPFPRSSMI